MGYRRFRLLGVGFLVLLGACTFDKAGLGPLVDADPNAPDASSQLKCSAALIGDDFEDQSLDTVIWSNINLGGTELGGVLTIEPAVLLIDQGIVSNIEYDFRNTTVAFEVANVPQAGTSGVGGIRFTTGGEQDYVVFWVRDGVLEALVWTPMNMTPISAVSFDPVAHRYLRVVENSGTAWQTSSDGVSWLPFGAAPTHPVLRGAKIAIIARDDGGLLDTQLQVAAISVCPN